MVMFSGSLLTANTDALASESQIFQHSNDVFWGIEDVKVIVYESKISRRTNLHAYQIALLLYELFPPASLELFATLGNYF